MIVLSTSVNDLPCFMFWFDKYLTFYDSLVFECILLVFTLLDVHWLLCICYYAVYCCLLYSILNMFFLDRFVYGIHCGGCLVATRTWANDAASRQLAKPLTATTWFSTFFCIFWQSTSCRWKSDNSIWCKPGAVGRDKSWWWQGTWGAMYSVITNVLISKGFKAVFVSRVVYVLHV